MAGDIMIDRRQLCKEILAGEGFQQILPQGQRWTEELQQYLEELVSTRKGLRAGLNLPTEVHLDYRLSRAGLKPAYV